MAYKKKNPKSGTGTKASNKHQVVGAYLDPIKKVSYKKAKRSKFPAFKAPVFTEMRELEFVGDTVRKRSPKSNKKK